MLQAHVTALAMAHVTALPMAHVMACYGTAYGIVSRRQHHNILLKDSHC